MLNYQRVSDDVEAPKTRTSTLELLEVRRGKLQLPGAQLSSKLGLTFDPCIAAC